MESFKIQDASSYDDVAANFARFTAIVTRPLAETMLDLADLRATDQILDIGTGSGIVALSAGRRVSQGGCVTGIDLSDGLLEIARESANLASLNDRVRFRKADAEALPFSDSTFERVLSLFALLHFPNPAKAIAEIFRVLKPNGKVVIGIGSRPSWRSLGGWKHKAGRLPDLIRLKSTRLLLAPYHLNGLIDVYLPGTDEPEETELARDIGYRSSRSTDLVRNAGFQQVRTQWEGHKLLLTDWEEFWELQSTFSSVARKRLRAASPAQIERVRTEFQKQCAQVLARGGTLEYHYAAFYIVGVRP